MADFDLTQTDAQVQSILDDAQDAMGAGAQTTLTTEYIMLKDTNGRYHKILKDSFTEAVRNVLGGLLVNNDKGTTISQIAAIASGDFGSVTPANLASVLGGLPSMFITANDANAITTPGFYQNSNWANNTPQTAGILIMPYYYTGYWRFQLFCDYTSNHMWFRSGTSSSYGTWKQIV